MWKIWKMVWWWKYYYFGGVGIRWNDILFWVFENIKFFVFDFFYYLFYFVYEIVCIYGWSEFMWVCMEGVCI